MSPRFGHFPNRMPPQIRIQLSWHVDDHDHALTFFVLGHFPSRMLPQIRCRLSCHEDDHGHASMTFELAYVVVAHHWSRLLQTSAKILLPLMLIGDDVSFGDCLTADHVLKTVYPFYLHPNHLIQMDCTIQIKANKETMLFNDPINDVLIMRSRLTNIYIWSTVWIVFSLNNFAGRLFFFIWTARILNVCGLI